MAPLRAATMAIVGAVGRTRQLRSAGDLDGIHALVLPGGESTTMLKLLAVEGMEAPLGRARPAPG